VESGRRGRENLTGCGSFPETGSGLLAQYPETRSHPSIKIWSKIDRSIWKSSFVSNILRPWEGQAESGIICENFTDFDVIRMDEAQEVEIYIVASDRPPGGFGKSAVPPIAPTVANAIFAATGKRVRQLPIISEKLKGSHDTLRLRSGQA
jgi:hypothetical protein